MNSSQVTKSLRCSKTSTNINQINESVDQKDRFNNEDTVRNGSLNDHERKTILLIH
jgi:hypothetical protein